MNGYCWLLDVYHLHIYDQALDFTTARSHTSHIRILRLYPLGPASFWWLETGFATIFASPYPETEHDRKARFVRQWARYRPTRAITQEAPEVLLMSPDFRSELPQIVVSIGIGLVGMWAYGVEMILFHAP